MAKSDRSSMKVNKKVIKETEALMKDFMKYLDVEADIDVSGNSYEDVDGNQEEFVEIDIDGEDIGILIGYLGRNLRSLQRIVGLLLNRRLGVDADESKYVRVVIDVSGYRDKREDSLKRMAEQVREEVIASDESVDLPSMNAFERRVIHTHLSENEDVTTESFGEGKDRYVRVFPVGETE
jgi:spoIIIJ-associated protein